MGKTAKKKIILAGKRGFCSGVKNALFLVEKVLAEAAEEDTEKRICVLHEIVHNDAIVNSLRKKGIIFIDEPEEAVNASTLIFSAHGVSPDVEKRSEKVCKNIVDATCPIVKKLHKTAEDFEKRNLSILLLGKRGHRETEGIAGRVEGKVTILQDENEVKSFLASLSSEEKKKTPFGCLSQTTMSAGLVKKMKELLAEKLANLEIAADVCYATKERQDAVKFLAQKCDMVFVAGSEKSSNSRRLVEIVKDCGKMSFLVPDPEKFVFPDLSKCETVGITSGASAPEYHVETLVKRLLDTDEFYLMENTEE
ncbi:MAG: 4-hydroxy-3-methylbut-2-enyl diphosphate reductase [Lentisphaeria bacterium]|nr:4-hydroxy-3-methylbut-2-enyl diphosphate reductase [Lentisphaeria bacterium]